MPSHGDSYNISGTFPSRSKSSPTLWDNGGTHGQAWDAVYDRRFSLVSPHEDYRDPTTHGRGISLPHSHVTKYIAGPCDDAGSDYAAMLVLGITGLTMPYWFVHDHYWHVDPNWDFSVSATQDNNFKRLGWGNGTYPESSLYNYLSFVTSIDDIGNWDSATAKPLQYILQGTGGGGFLEPGGDNVEYSETMNCNPCEGWLKESMAIRVSDTSGQAQFHLYTDQGGSGGGGFKALYNLSGGSTRWDTMSGTARTINPNGTSFVRDTGPDNWVYDVDVYVDIDTTPARIYLTNHATFTSSSIFEIQPYTAWSTTEVTITVNQGKLPDGTAHIHLRDENAGHSYIGTLTLGAGGGTVRGSSLGGLG